MVQLFPIPVSIVCAQQDTGIADLISRELRQRGILIASADKQATVILLSANLPGPELEQARTSGQNGPVVLALLDATPAPAGLRAQTVVDFRTLRTSGGPSALQELIEAVANAALLGRADDQRRTYTWLRLASVATVLGGTILGAIGLSAVQRNILGGVSIDAEKPAPPPATATATATATTTPPPSPPPVPGAPPPPSPPPVPGPPPPPSPPPVPGPPPPPSPPPVPGPPPPPSPPPPPTPPPTSEQVCWSQQRFSVFFPRDRADLTPDSVDIINAGVAYARAGGCRITLVSVVGHADSPESHASPSGSATDADSLSGRRALLVKTSLMNAGVAESTIVTEAKGTSEPAQPSLEGAPEPLNRRVDIQITIAS